MQRVIGPGEKTQHQRGGETMRQSYITTVFALVAVLFTVVLPFDLYAQTGEKFYDFRGRAYSVQDLEQALFPEVQPEMLTRGIPKQPRPGQVAPPPSPLSAPEKPIAVALNVFFETNSDKILPKYYADLDKLGEALKRHANIPVEIAGHTDSIGSDEYNQELSERRAESVKRYLVQSLSIPSERVTAKGYGENQPRETNETTKGRGVNRRVEVVRTVQ
jgi:outer membrane protein OmpA-like peptidoglycan-associated protein